MALRHTLTSELTEAIVLNHVENLGVDINTLETYTLAAGNAHRVVSCLKDAVAQGLFVDAISLLAIDLVGEDPVGLVQAYATATKKDPTLTFRDMMKQFETDKETAEKKGWR